MTHVKRRTRRITLKSTITLHTKKLIVAPKIFSDPNLFCPKILFRPNIFFEPKIFSDPNFFFRPKIVWELIGGVQQRGRTRPRARTQSHGTYSLVWYILKVCGWTLICKRILRNQALKLSNIQTHIAELQAYQSVFFWIMRACLVYYILKVCGWTLICSIWCLGLIDRFWEIKL